jgi:hypothetical protein
MRADHSWPQRRQLYQATIHVLSDAGSTDRPQAGQNIAAVVENVWNMAGPRATLVPTAARIEHGKHRRPEWGEGGITSATAQNVARAGAVLRRSFERTNELNGRSRDCLRDDGKHVRRGVDSAAMNPPHRASSVARRRLRSKYWRTDVRIGLCNTEVPVEMMEEGAAQGFAQTTKGAGGGAPLLLSSTMSATS